MSELEEKQAYLQAATFKERRFQPYALAIGRAALAWNSLSEALGGLFWTLMGDAWLARPMAIWQSVKMDRPKRDMLAGISANMPKNFYELYPKAKDEIAWLIKETTKLEDVRNNVIHAPLQLVAPVTSFKAVGPWTRGKQRREIPDAAEVVPQDWQLNERAKRLAGRHLLSEFRWCHETAIALRDYANAIDHTLRGTSRSWPERPRMPNRGGSSAE